MTVVVSASCCTSAGDSGEPAGATGGATDAPSEAVGASDVISGDARPEFDGTVPDANLDARWQPGGDPGWSDWVPSECPTMQVATHPEYAVPPLVWEPCAGNSPGCQQLVFNWPLSGGESLIEPKVFKDGATLRVSLNLFWEQQTWRKAIYDETMRPIAAWRGPFAGDKDCGGTYLEWTPKHACVVLLHSLAGGFSKPGVHALLDPVDGKLLSYATSQASVGLSCSGDLFATMDLVSTGYLRDLVSDVEHVLNPPAGITYHVFTHNDVALVTRWSGSSTGDILDAWLWQRPDSLTRLFDPGSQLVYNIQTDGQTLAWIQAPATSIYDVSSGDLWTSPFSTDPAQIKPSKLRAVPTTAPSPGYGKLGPGFYAVIEGNMSQHAQDTRAHVYRLSDGRHWVVPNPEGVAAGPVLSVDSDEIWFVGLRSTLPDETIIRQRLDVLGPGD